VATIMQTIKPADPAACSLRRHRYRG
jgi:hypothetical protein